MIRNRIKNENSMSYDMTKIMEKELKELGKKATAEVMNKLELEVSTKLLDVMEPDIDKIIGFEVTTGQMLVLLSDVCRRLEKSFGSIATKHYGLVGKDKKQKRKELQKFIGDLFIQGLMEMDSKKEND